MGTEHSVISERTGISGPLFITIITGAVALAAAAGTAHYRVGALEKHQDELRAEVKEGRAEQQAAAQQAATLLERVTNVQKSLERIERRLGTRTPRGDE